MEPNVKRRPVMDVFGEVEYATPEELRGARVRSNVYADGSEHRKVKRPRTGPELRDLQATLPRAKHTPTTSNFSKEDTPIDSDAPTEIELPVTRSQYKGKSVRSDDPMSNGDSVFHLPEEGSYLPEVENDIENVLNHEPPNSGDPPVRILKDFSIFEACTLKLVSLACFWDIDVPCEAFGQAIADVDEEEHDAREFFLPDAIPFRTSTILSISLDIQQDSIWIQTQYAWYLLETPAKAYQPYFLPFYSREMLLRHILRSILLNHGMTRGELLRKLASPTAMDPIIRRCWNNEDLSRCRYSLSELTEVIAAIPDIEWEDVMDAPLLQVLIEDDECTPMKSVSQGFVPRISAPLRKRKRTAPVKTIGTTVTAAVQAAVSPYFDQKFTIVGERPSYLDEDKLARGQPQIQLLTDEIKFKAGDFVIINEGDFEDKDTMRFAQILFFDRRNKNFHARWFVHGTQTILQEVAPGQELFLSTADECRDVSADSLVSKIDVVRISSDEYSTQSWPEEDKYFYWAAWDRKHPAGFTEVLDQQVHIPSSRICLSCEGRDSPISHFVSRTSSVIRSVKYHQHDFIRYEACSPNQITCSIGQISTFLKSGDEVKLLVYRLGRESVRMRPGCFAEPALFLTSVTETVNASLVLGTCQVLHISEYECKDHAWLDDHPDCFYSTDFRRCQICYAREEENYNLEKQCRSEMQLCAFDPFAGVGGFGLGLAQGCAMRTCLGIEINPSAAETMRQNFPSDTTVITGDASQFLRDLVNGRRVISDQITMIYSGPPCQNDSTLNRHKTDTKWPVFTTLSYLDYIRPPFFIMESVPGFFQWKIPGSTNENENEIKAGGLKLVLKYNIAGQLMHARSFGIPQTRDRFFLVATLPDWGVFKLPDVSHAFRAVEQPKVQSFRFGSHLKIKSAVAPGKALHEVVTVAETLSDLPFFDWASPKKLTREQKQEAKVRAKLIPTVPCLSDGVWGIPEEDFKYESPSANAYQRRARQNLVVHAQNSYQHFTKQFPQRQVENICDVPLARGADYRHLDQKNREWSLRDPASAKAMGGYQAGAYSRLNPDGYFHTIVTNVGPVAKQSSVIHPFCKRILTVRELARAQGFPDDFTFYSETDKIDDYHKQIGNSVPFGVSAALGRSIQSMVFNKWLGERKKRA